MIRDMKWYIYSNSEDGYPLCTDEDKVLEFDTEESVKRFYNSVMKEWDFPEEFRTWTIKHCILYYDGGYFNATNYIVNEEREVVPYEEK